MQATAQKRRLAHAHRAAENAEALEGDILRGQGFAYARYVHSKWPGFGAAWSAWVADVEVNQKTGEVQRAPRGGRPRRRA